MTQRKSTTEHLTLTGEPGRLDKVLAARFPDISRARLQKLIEDGAVRVNSKSATTASKKLAGHETIELFIPEAAEAAPRAQTIALDIVYEDKDLLVINKGAGMVVHPAAGNLDGTLVNALLAHCGASLSGIGGVKRPGIVHRLDKDTSGLMVVAKNDAAHQGLSAQFAAGDKTLCRTYLAIIWGAPAAKRGTITGAIGRSPVNRKKMAITSSGKHAVTHYQLVEIFSPELHDTAQHIVRKKKSSRKENTAPYAALLQCELETGRTHQIRVHLAHMGNSIIGDALYGNAKGCKQRAEVQLKKAGLDPDAPDSPLSFPRQALHAAELRFIHPVTGKAMHFKADLPEDMKGLLNAVRCCLSE